MCPCLNCFNSTPCFDQCRTEWVGCPLFLDEKIVEQPTNLVKLTEKYTEAAQAFIERNVEKQTPFFLYLAYHQTHHPQFASSDLNKNTPPCRIKLSKIVNIYRVLSSDPTKVKAFYTSLK